VAFSSFSDFIHMGGHGVYVWLSYSVGVAVLLYNLLWPRMHKSAIYKKLAQQFKRESRNSRENMNSKAVIDGPENMNNAESS